MNSYGGSGFTRTELEYLLQLHREGIISNQYILDLLPLNIALSELLSFGKLAFAEPAVPKEIEPDEPIQDRWEILDL